MTIPELCRRHGRIGIDSNVLVCLLEDAGALAGTSRALIDALEDGLARGVASTIGLAEIAAGPARAAGPAEVERVVDEVRSIEGLTWRPVSAEIAIDAGIIRGARRVRLPDAIHLATARAAGATVFVTNDRRLRSGPRLEVVYLEDLDLADRAG
jgi:predicted nucleic acid-binding protein